jgi:hypothetical protein
MQQRKQIFLIRSADFWKQAGYPIRWKHQEWKFDEIEPNWQGALAAMYLKRSPEEIAKANAFFQAMPIDWKIDPDMRVCEVLHTYYLFRNDPNLTPAAKKRLLDIIHFQPAPRRLNPSIWKFSATENHAFMGHVWCLLTAQIDGDKETVKIMTRHIDTYIVEHIKKGWLEYNSPCYVEKEVGCLIMLAEWAQDPVLRKKAQAGLDVLFAEHAALNLEGMLAGPACRVYGHQKGPVPLGELGHNSRRDASCSGSYPMMYMLFGQGQPHFYGVLGAPLLATSSYVPPIAVHVLATAGQARGAYEFKARRPGHGHKLFHHNPDADTPPPQVFDARVYAWVTPHFIFGSFQQVQGKYSALRSLPLTSVLRMAGSTRRVIYTDLMLGPRKEMDKAVVDCAQYKNVTIGRGIVGQAYLATKEFDQLVEQNGWIFIHASKTFAAYRVIEARHTWQHVNDPSVFGDFITFTKPDAPFVLEAAEAGDYDGDFARFQQDILDNQITHMLDSVTYESCSNGKKGPSSQPFTLTLRYGKLPLLDGKPIELENYGTFDSPYLNSGWDSGIVKLCFGSHQLTIDVTHRGSPLRLEETIHCPP